MKERSNSKTKLFAGIDTVILRVKDLELSREWYEKNLGLKAVFEDENIKLVVFNTGSPTSLTIWQWENEEPNHPSKNFSSFPIFRSMNAKRDHAFLSSQGVKVEDVVEEKGIKYFTFYDFDGNKLEACEIIE